MACFCKLPAAKLPSFQAKLPSFQATATADVSAVPPQLGALADIMGLESASLTARVDETMGAQLPKSGGDAWIRATLKAQVPNMALPVVLPSGGGPMIKVALKLAMSPLVAANPMILVDPKAMAKTLQQMAASLAANVLPQMAPIKAMPQAMFVNMTLAARLTLALRAKGICPMALTGVDAQFSMKAGLAEPRARLSQTMSFAATIVPPKVPKLIVTPPQLALAATLSAIAPLATAPKTLGLPPASDPQFVEALKKMIAGVAAAMIPAMPMIPDELLAMAAKVEAMATIKEAFGEDAMTPAGVVKVNAMLKVMARLQLPVPPPTAIALQAKLDALPKMEDVTLGAQTLQSSGASIAASMTMPPPALPLAPLLDAVQALHAVLAKALGEAPLGACSSCDFAA